MKVIHLLHQILREIFEEASYERFCIRKQLAAGTDSYAAFLAEAEGAKDHKIRCC